MEKHTEPKLKRLNARILKLKEGEKHAGIFRGKSTAPWLDPATGEESDLTRLYFEGPTGEKVIIFEDAGLRNAMANSMVTEGQFIEIHKQAKMPLKGGRSVNTYDIYGLDG